MSLLRDIQTRVIRRQYDKSVRALETGAPEDLTARGERRLLQAFQRAATQVPAYRELLQREEIDPAQITSAEEFTRTVPVLDKQMVFADNALRDLCVGGTLDGIGAFYSSSGHSGVFSFGVETWEELGKAALSLEFILDTMFSVFKRKTLLINCLPMGVKVPTRTIPVADTSVRPDVVFALLDKLESDFEQFIVVGESPFLKKLLEEGADAGVPWHDLLVHVITGGEFIAENMRSYFGHLLGLDFEDPSRGLMLVNMGLSELGLSLFAETPRTIRLRRLAHKDPDLREALGGSANEACPAIMQYNPLSTYVESIRNEDGRSDLVISLLSPDLKIPLMRYNTGDEGRIMPYGVLGDILGRFGHEALSPRFRFPLAVISGKKQRVEVGERQWLSPDEVKEAIYQDFDIARAVTGNFRLDAGEQGAEITLQLRREREAPSDAVQRIADHLKPYTEASVQIDLVPFEQFPYGLDHSFERKNQYV